MRVIHVLRKPLSEKTVAANTVKHGTGGLNIDASRIGDATRIQSAAGGIGDGSIYSTADEYEKGTGREYRIGRRWPANVILQHLDGCRCEGTKSVKSNGHYPASRPAGSSIAGASGHIGQDALVEMHTKGEQIPNWICVEGCSVTRLDEQSGELGNNYRASKANGSTSIWGSGSSSSVDSISDTGGASRFYKQVGGKSDG